MNERLFGQGCAGFAGSSAYPAESKEWGELGLVTLPPPPNVNEVRQRDAGIAVEHLRGVADALKAVLPDTVHGQNTNLPALLAMVSIVSALQTALAARCPAITLKVRFLPLDPEKVPVRHAAVQYR